MHLRPVQINHILVRTVQVIPRIGEIGKYIKGLTVMQDGICQFFPVVIEQTQPAIRPGAVRSCVSRYTFWFAQVPFLSTDKITNTPRIMPKIVTDALPFHSLRIHTPYPVNPQRKIDGM
ncbi:MAG TPA: hypothetical protein DIU35_05640 [Candidatus Latescibacteria bacterium]|nr:hypothetical protein [Candidatus Latescibacterota bacterium]